ncbi:MAG: FlgO family outer membrane protein, partial [Planctomycetota bacterium]
MRSLVNLGLVALLLVTVGCRSRAARFRGHQRRIDQEIAKCDRYIAEKKPAYAIKHYNRFIDYYRKKPGFEPGLARMLAKRAAAYAILGNLKRAGADVAQARQLDARVVVPTAPPPTAPPPGSGASSNPGSGRPTAPALGPDGIPAHQGDPIPIAVLNFEGAGDGAKYSKTFGPLLAEDLFNRGRFDVFEREELDKLVGELKLTQTDLIAKAGSAEGRKLLPVDFLILGTITVEGNGVIINARFVDWHKGQIVVTQTAKKMCQTGNVSFYLDEIAHDLGV